MEVTATIRNRRKESDKEGPSRSSTSAADLSNAYLTLCQEVFLLAVDDVEGEVSMWNDYLPIVLRGCILAELGLRGRIHLDSQDRFTSDIDERLVGVISREPCGDHLLDEALNRISSSPAETLRDWISLLSGETWNFMKMSYQMKNVRERVAKQLVDKSILQAVQVNKVLFDTICYPMRDATAKKHTVDRLLQLKNGGFREELFLEKPRDMCLLLLAHAAGVLENIVDYTTTLDYESFYEAFSNSLMMKDFAKFRQNVIQLANKSPSEQTNTKKYDLVFSVIFYCFSSWML